MYKKAFREKLRFNIGQGVWSTEALFEISMSNLKKVVEVTHKQLKELSKAEDDDLAFLESEVPTENKELELAKLRFEIAKDVYVTRRDERTAASEDAKNAAEIKHLEEVLARRKEQELENLSSEELEKKIAALREKK
jgi:hypothetical protein